MWNSLGKITCTTHNVPVRLTSGLPDPTARVPCQTITVQQIPGNAGYLYLCERSTASYSTYVGILLILAPPATGQQPVTASHSVPNAQDGLNVASLYLSSSADGEGGLCSYLDV
jgi:hypothetical protein